MISTKRCGRSSSVSWALSYDDWGPEVSITDYYVHRLVIYGYLGGIVQHLNFDPRTRS